MKLPRVAVVTGASAGVGRATARRLAQKGLDVGLVARGEAGLEATANEIEDLGVRALPLPADVTDFAALDHAASRAEQVLGPIDVWVNDAMATTFAPCWDMQAEDFRRAVEVTFLGQVWGTQVALSKMRPRNKGTIVNVGSALAYVGIPLQSAYCASKFACRGFFESTRAELLHCHSKVALKMVHLPAVNTPQFDWCATTMEQHPQPVPPIYQPEVAADSIVAAALGGRTVRVLGSWNKLLILMGRLFPNLANHYAAIGAWDTQLTDRPVSPDRPANLFCAADSDRDWSAHGAFDSQANGLADPQFLRSLPEVLATFLRAVIAAAKEDLSSSTS